MIYTLASTSDTDTSTIFTKKNDKNTPYNLTTLTPLKKHNTVVMGKNITKLGKPWGLRYYRSMFKVRRCGTFGFFF